LFPVSLPTAAIQYSWTLHQFLIEFRQKFSV
jgi:hypothetical protein